MKYSTIAAPAKLQHLTTDQLLTAWETTEYLNIPEIHIVRGWLMDEIERRNPDGFNAWLDQDAPEDTDLRKYVSVNPLCLGCSKWCNGCNGTTNQVWTGCIFRRT